MRMSTLNGRAPTPVEAMEAASGKLLLLGKLLPKLRSEGRKVLIFSQFKIMLDVVEEYLELLELPMERIDGDTKGGPPAHTPRACFFTFLCMLCQVWACSLLWRKCSPSNCLKLGWTMLHSPSRCIHSDVQFAIRVCLAES